MLVVVVEIQYSVLTQESCGIGAMKPNTDRAIECLLRVIVDDRKMGGDSKKKKKKKTRRKNKIK